MSHEIYTLDPVVFPKQSPWKREDFFAPQDQFPDFAEKYDSQTLFYQAIQEDGQIRLLAPRLLNFEPLLHQGEFTTKHQRLTVKKIIKYRRHAEVLLDCPSPADAITFHIKDFSQTVKVLQPFEGLKGANILVTRQKNNLLDWVRVWGSHHVEHQCVTGIVIVDNGSTDYSVGELSQCLTKIDGLENSVVIDAPFKFGPIAKNRPRNRGLFYQAAMLNLVKHGFAHNANAALCCVDIDELIYSENSETIFEEMERSNFGYVCAPGHWRYASKASEPHILHSDHIYKSASREWSREKYCIKINGRFGGLPWDIHNVGRGRFNKQFYSKTKGFYHCEQLSTSWVVNRAEPTVSDISIDPQTENYFDINIKPIESN